VLALAPAIPPPAAAQGSIGLGPRFSFVRGSVDAESSTRYAGGLLRLRSSPRTALEVSIDYRSVLNDDLTQRIKDYPIQGSLLLYVTRTTLAPYLLGGIGWYSLKITEVDSNGLPVGPPATTRKTGYHTGLGADLRVGNHATVHADYRYTFIHFGQDDAEADTAPGAIPIPGSTSIQEKLKLSHQGSMWTTGITVYF
jgi:opacity protein-like surface antigen